MELVISSRLFPPQVIARACNALGPGLRSRTVRIGRERAMVRFDPAGGQRADHAHLFKAALTAAAIQYFDRQRGSRPPASTEPVGQIAHLSMELSGDRLRVSLRVPAPRWPGLLRALGRLQLTAPVVESTDPTDRVVLVLHLLGNGPVEDALREFLAALRAELAGPAA